MDDLIISFLSILKRAKTPSDFTIDGGEFWCRCPYCGDSVKNSNRGHFYIATKPPFPFYCQRCTEDGRLTNNILRDLGIFDTAAFLTLAELNKNYEESADYIPPVEKKLIIDNRPSRAYDYMRRRFNHDFTTVELAEKYRCILNVKDFIDLNNLREFSEKTYFDFENSIGFISDDDSHITFRSIVNSKMRYFVLAVNEYGSKTYFIKNQVDVLYPKTSVHITEGCFDIVGVETFIVDSSNLNNVFIAACGKSFMRAVKSLTHKGFLNLDINFYSDTDVKLSTFTRLKRDNFELSNNDVRVFYNNKHSDFGVPRDKIMIREAVLR